MCSKSDCGLEQQCIVCLGLLLLVIGYEVHKPGFCALSLLLLMPCQWCQNSCCCCLIALRVRIFYFFSFQILCLGGANDSLFDPFFCFGTFVVGVERCVKKNIDVFVTMKAASLNFNFMCMFYWTLKVALFFFWLKP